MKIAVTFENGKVFQHFGHTEQFKIYEAEDGKIISSQVVDTMGQGHGALAGFLKEHQVTDLICGGIGGGARQALAQALAEGKLTFDPDAECSHHGEGHHGEGHGSCHGEGHHGEGHCGGHGEGHGSCGHH